MSTLALFAACHGGAAHPQLGADAAPVTDAVADASDGTERYEIRIARGELDANGHTKHEVFAFGTRADGTYADDPVVLGVDRASAGTYLESDLVLGPLGARSYFTPCDRTSASCLGSATLTLALASAPSTPVATAPITLVAPSHVSTVDPCLVGGNVVYVDGVPNSLRDGMLTALGGGWINGVTSTNLGLRDGTGVPGGGDWDIVVDTMALGTPLVPGVYRDTQRQGQAQPGHAGMSVDGNGRSCSAQNSSFELVDLASSGGSVTAATISFELYCANGTALTEGCFHYESP